MWLKPPPQRALMPSSQALWFIKAPRVEPDGLFTQNMINGRTLWSKRRESFFFAERNVLLEMVIDSDKASRGKFMRLNKRNASVDRRTTTAFVDLGVQGVRSLAATSHEIAINFHLIANLCFAADSLDNGVSLIFNAFGYCVWKHIACNKPSTENVRRAIDQTCKCEVNGF